MLIASQLKAVVMLLAFEQLFGSGLNYRRLHAALRIASLIAISLTLAIILSGWAETLAVKSFGISLLLCMPIVIVTVVIIESFRLRHNHSQHRAVAIDWLFVIASLAVWCVEMFRILTTFG
jgi:hypothetical protein